MAEGISEDTSSWESWLGGWVQAAKEKSSTAYEFVKKDLAEFSSTVQKETEKAIEKTSSSLTRENTEQATTKVKAGISSFLSNVSRALVIPPSDDYVPVKVSADGSTLYDRGKARLHAIQLDASTYVDPPRGSSEQFEMWLNSFDMDQHKGEVSEILVSKVGVRALYTKLVPNEVSHAEFWQRYFYRVHQMECDEARKQALMQRADSTHRDSLSWDEDDWSGGEEDEGHESDWEKMPRPHQQMPSNQSSETQKLSTPSTPPSNDTLHPTQQHIPKDESPIQNPLSVENTKDSVSECEHHSVSLQVSNIPKSNGQDSASFSAENTPADSGLEAVHDYFSADNKSHSPEEASATEANPISPPQNIEIPADTASACKSSVEQVLSPEDAQGPEPGAPAEIPGKSNGNDLRDSVPCNSGQNPGVSSAAAASGVELPSSSDEAICVKGDAACGASDVLPSSSSSSTTILENDASNRSTPEASPASKDTSTSLRTEVQECSNAMAEIDVKPSPAEPNGSSNLKTVKDDNITDLAMRVKGDMVVVGETDTPSSDSSEAKGLEDDWDEDFDVEVTEEDLKAAEDIARKLGENLDTEDDWENWD